MGASLVLGYGVVSYGLFLVVFLYAIGFVGNLVVPKAIDTGNAGSTGAGLAVDVLLLGLFAVQHSVMARPVFKRWLTQYIPKAIERSTFVLISSLLLALLFWQWRPFPAVVWSVETPLGRLVLQALFALGWLLVLSSTCMIDHFDLFGVKQVRAYARGETHQPPPFVKRAFYRYVRHPIMLGFIIAFWATPRMTAGHLLFAVATTAYILIGVALEERDLLTFHGAEYEAYRQEVPALVPLPRARSGAPATPDVSTPPAAS
ncbi:MAG: isoprenylcysteine carboxylmethyltransferase family protein [Armatimonadetes bacterium]|nr:isoprenylcysteine carboxylmethyltransferase family protein [Armatimonadota bacterium]